MNKLSFPTVKLGNYINEVKIKVKNSNYNQSDLIVYGVTNTNGVTITNNKASDDLGNYTLIGENQFVYNPYRVNVGSIGLTGKETFGAVSPAYVVFETTYELDSGFLLHYLKSNLGINLVKWYGDRGGVRSALRFNDLKNIDIPALSLGEQLTVLRKVNAVDILLNQLSNTHNITLEYISSLRQSILQKAVEGKLCVQNSNDEPASALLKKIKVEKKKLIKEKKIKKQKDLPPISENEKPFKLPNGWEWCRLGVICEINPRNTISNDLDVSFISMSMIESGYKNSHTHEKKKWLKIKTGFTHFRNDDIGIAKITPCFENRKSVIFKDLHNGYGSGTTELVIIRSNELILNEYLLAFFKTQNFIDNGTKTYTGTAGQQRIGKEYIAKCIIPIPPFAEQQRIVEKVNTLMVLCDELAEEISNSKKYASQLMESVLQEAFGNANEKKKDNVLTLIPKQSIEKDGSDWSVAARGNLKESTWENLIKRADEITREG